MRERERGLAAVSRARHAVRATGGTRVAIAPDMDLLAAGDAPPIVPALERTALLGSAAFTDAELLTLVMSGPVRPERRPGRPRLPATTRTRAAERVLRAAGSLRGLAAWSFPEIASIPGVGERRAAPLVAALELGRRTALERKERGASLNGAGEVYRHYRAALRDERREIFLVALLDARHRLLRDARIAEGSLSATLVHPREAFAPAVREPAHAVVFVHNHPSGDPTPSDEDVALTRRLVAAGDILGIRVLDHVVLGEEDWYSFAEAGALRAS